MKHKTVAKMENEKQHYAFDDLFNEKAEYNILDLKNALNTMLYDDSLCVVNTFIEAYFLSKQDMSFCSVKKFCIQAFVLLELVLKERNLLNDNVYAVFLEIWNKIDHFNTTESMEEWFEETLKTIFQRTRATEEEIYDKIIRSINDIIEKNYANIKNIGEIASQLFISESYARKIYKQHTGKTIFEKLFLTKMEHAVHLIVDRKMPTQQVYLMVGYRSKTAFLDAFKRYTGYLPTEYLESINSTESKG